MRGEGEEREEVEGEEGEEVEGEEREREEGGGGGGGGGMFILYRKKRAIKLLKGKGSVRARKRGREGGRRGEGRRYIYLMYDCSGPDIQACVCLQTSPKGTGDVIGSHTVRMLWGGDMYTMWSNSIMCMWCVWGGGLTEH